MALDPSKLEGLTDREVLLLTCQTVHLSVEEVEKLAKRVGKIEEWKNTINGGLKVVSAVASVAIAVVVAKVKGKAP